jgi:hypothetical protein
MEVHSYNNFPKVRQLKKKTKKVKPDLNSRAVFQSSVLTRAVYTKVCFHRPHYSPFLRLTPLSWILETAEKCLADAT